MVTMGNAVAETGLELCREPLSCHVDRHEKYVLANVEWLNTLPDLGFLSGVSSSGFNCADLCARIGTTLTEAGYGDEFGHRK